IGKDSERPIMRAFGLPHFGQTSRCGTVILGVLLRFWRRSAGIVSGCIGVLLIISNRRQPVASDRRKTDRRRWPGRQRPLKSPAVKRSPALRWPRNTALVI